ncbi:MAG TPA: TAXI family TRAP transporter solute-binding subunit [Burkholderiales bacterium]|nr:TAXI family TRAP transporter solute-binding subunit [Burkholderiales bacterium]
MKFRLRDLHLRDALVVGVPALVILVAGFWFTAQFIKPAPPTRLVIATGGDGGAYQRFAAQYKPLIERNGVEFVERSTAGAVENLALLRSPDVEELDVAFVQGGLGVGSDADGLVSLGSVYYEPLWVFYRAKEPSDRLVQLRGKRIAIGAEGSGTRKLGLELLEASGAAAAPTKLSPLGGLEAVEALRGGQVDAIFLVGPANSGAVWASFFGEGFRLMSFAQADAYVRRWPFLSRLTLPRGAIDLVRDIPGSDVTLVAPVATLVARESIHPALVGLLLDTATEVHGKPGLFQRAGEFPNPQQVDFPLSSEAERFYKSGRRFLQRYLPFWAANLIDRLIVLLIPLVALALPLMRIVPSLYGWRVRSRVYKWYGQLKFLEAAWRKDPNARPRAEWLKELDELDARVNRVRTPLAFANQLYILREHIGLVRRAVEGTVDPGAALPGAASSS